MKYWAVIPAAGVGSRMQSDIPKQYLQIANKTIIEHTLALFIQHPKIAGVVVAISTGDEYWPDLAIDLAIAADESVIVAEGGAERCHSVLSSLHSLSNHAAGDDWVLP